MKDYTSPIGPRKPLLVERSTDSVYLDGEWHQRERRREHYDGGSCSPWETLRCDPLLRAPAGEA